MVKMLMLNKNVKKVVSYGFINNFNCFFVFNVRNLNENIYLNSYFIKHNLHPKNELKFFYENLSLELFSGNVVYCFVDHVDFFNKLLDLYFFKIVEYELDLIGVCYKNYFLNFNLSYSNVLNCLYLNFSIIFFLVLLFINLFFFKLCLIFRVNMNIKKC